MVEEYNPDQDVAAPEAREETKIGLAPPPPPTEAQREQFELTQRLKNLLAPDEEDKKVDYTYNENEALPTGNNVTEATDVSMERELGTKGARVPDAEAMDAALKGMDDSWAAALEAIQLRGEGKSRDEELQAANDALNRIYEATGAKDIRIDDVALDDVKVSMDIGQAAQLEAARGSSRDGAGLGM